MLRLALLVALSCATNATSQCCFKDGDVISLKSDKGTYMGRCTNCVWNGAFDNSAFVHVPSPGTARKAQWTVVNTGNGKIALQADSGKYLARCNNCAPGAAYPDEAFVHVTDWKKAPWAQWTCKDVGDGKVALQADSGKYLARCKNCVGAAYSNAAFVHAQSPNEGSWQYALAFVDDGAYDTTLYVYASAYYATVH
ncbi:cytochrome P450 [Achlya hypogyna]|uniref:Cytochrome P450 n=1 Tax=Achlya hypogyna TaxID=1202772 RepID=A0A0A7CLV7_ACHHY|nr:secreted protein [Achlya hypogyna]OQR93333.1 cytochrome P450 [Achlya hypogyna]